MVPLAKSGKSGNWLDSSQQALLAMVSGVIALLGLASLIVAASIYYAARAVDADARQAQSASVAAALNVLASGAASSLTSMAVIDDVRNAQAPGLDEQWLRGDFRRHAQRAANISALMILDRNGSPLLHSNSEGGGADGVAEQLGGVLRDGALSIEQLVKAGASSLWPARAHSAFRYTLWQGQPSLVTISPFHREPGHEKTREAWSHLAAVHKLDDAFLADLRGLTGIATLSWATGQKVLPDIARIEIGGRTEGMVSLVWVAGRPGLVLIQRAKPGLILALGLLLIVAAAVIAVTAAAIRRLALQKLHAESLASTDQLTGLANRRHFNASLDRLIASPADMRHGFSLLIIDLDRFKPLNDTYGHDAGDCALKEIAARLMNLTASAMVAARLGGDEFAILAPGLTGRDADILAAKIVAAVSIPIELPGGQQASLGASVGVSEAPLDGMTARELCLRADAALYRAKDLGRNTAISARSLEPSPVEVDAVA